MCSSQISSEKCPHGLAYVNNWSLIGGASWEGCGTFERWGLSESKHDSGMDF